MLIILPTAILRLTEKDRESPEYKNLATAHHINILLSQFKEPFRSFRMANAIFGDDAGQRNTIINVAEHWNENIKKAAVAELQKLDMNDPDLRNTAKLTNLLLNANDVYTDDGEYAVLTPKSDYDPSFFNPELVRRTAKIPDQMLTKIRTNPENYVLVTGFFFD